MRIVEVGVGAVLADMLTPLSPSMARALASFVLPGTRTQLAGVIRYPENTTAAELAGILAAGLGVLFVGECRKVGWTPNASYGSADALRVVTLLRALGVPFVDPSDATPLTIGCDLEGIDPTAVQGTKDYARAWCDVVTPQHARPAGYVGDGVPLSPGDLYQLPFQLYWHSLSNVQQVAVCDYALWQAYPTQKLELLTGSLEVDLDFVTRDKKMRCASMIVSG